jgi:hypothetical protein
VRGPNDLKPRGYGLKKFSRRVYIDLIGIKPAPPIARLCVMPELGEDEPAESVVKWDGFAFPGDDARIGDGQFSDEAPRFIGAAIVEDVNEIAPPGSFAE